MAINSPVTTQCQIYDQTKFQMVKCIDNAFDHIELKNRRIISVLIGLFFQEITFITEFPGSNFLLPTFLTGDKWDFRWQIPYLPLLNLDPGLSCFCSSPKMLMLIISNLPQHTPDLEHAMASLTDDLKWLTS